MPILSKSMQICRSPYEIKWSPIVFTYFQLILKFLIWPLIRDNGSQPELAMDSIYFNSHGIFAKISIYLKHRFLWQQNTSKQICILLYYLLQQRPNWESSFSNWVTISSGHWSRSVHTLVHNGPEYISRPLLAKFCSEGILFFHGSLWDFFGTAFWLKGGMKLRPP